MRSFRFLAIITFALIVIALPILAQNRFRVGQIEVAPGQQRSGFLAVPPGKDAGERIADFRNPAAQRPGRRLQ